MKFKLKKAHAALVLVVLLFVATSGCIQLGDNAWALEMTQITALTDMGFTGAGITIGIVDTGIDNEHPDLEDIAIKEWKDFVNTRSMPYDDNGHGTHVAGILAAQGSLIRFLTTGFWLKGIAPDAEYIIVKAIDAEGVGSDENIADGITFCVDKGADIICLSLGGKKWFSFIGTETESAAEYAINAGVFVVAAAGNEGPYNDDVAIPASLKYTIAVGAVNEEGIIAPFSSRGDNNRGTLFFSERDDPDKKPELVAPGVGIISTWPDAQYARASGTSQSVPYVAGILALLLEARPEYQKEALEEDPIYTIILFKNVLAQTAKDADEQKTPHDDFYGYGIIQAYDAYEGLVVI